MSPISKTALLVLLTVQAAIGATATPPRSTAEIQKQIDSKDDAAWFCRDCFEGRVEFTGDVTITQAFLFDGGDDRRNMVLNGNIAVRGLSGMSLVMIADMTVNGNVTVEGDAPVHIRGCNITGEVRGGKNVKYFDTTVKGQKKANDLEEGPAL